MCWTLGLSTISLKIEANKTIAKNDGRTHYKAYPLPYKSIKDTDSFYEALESILKYTNTNKNGMLSINTGFQFQ